MKERNISHSDKKQVHLKGSDSSNRQFNSAICLFRSMVLGLDDNDIGEGKASYPV